MRPTRLILAGLCLASCLTSASCVGSDTLLVDLKFTTMDAFLHTETVRVSIHRAGEDVQCSSLLTQGKRGEFEEDVAPILDTGVQPACVIADRFDFGENMPRGNLMLVGIGRSDDGTVLQQGCRQVNFFSENEGDPPRVVFQLLATTEYNRDFAPVTPPYRNVEEKCGPGVEPDEESE